MRSRAVRSTGRNERRGRQAGPPFSSEPVVALAGDQNAVAVSDDLAARDLGLVGDHRVELLVANPAGDDGADDHIKARLTLHDLRHTFGSHLVPQGADVVTVSRQMGHARPSITLDVYSHEFAAVQHRHTIALQLTKRIQRDPRCAVS